VTPLYLPTHERALVIRDYAQQYKIRVFVETGTNVGETTAALLSDFDVLNTIELDPALHQQAQRRFGGHGHVNCLLGDSGEWLRSVVPYFDTPVLFWLDGHYSGGITARGVTDTPIVAELEAAVHAPEGSVILIDDMRLFGGMQEHTEEFADYPHVDAVRALVESNRFHFTVKNDIGRCTPLCLR
jgi:hypothetical protein